MWFGAGSPPVTACQNETGWPRTIVGCSMSSSTRTAGTFAATSQRATHISRRTRGSRSAERPILTTTGALPSRKIAFSPTRRSSAPSLLSPACWHASRSTGSAAKEENSAASGTRPRIPGSPGAVKRLTLPEGKPVRGGGEFDARPTCVVGGVCGNGCHRRSRGLGWPGGLRLCGAVADDAAGSRDGCRVTDGRGGTARHRAP